MSDAAAFLTSLLEECVRTDASDLHLASGELPYLRIHGVLAPIPEHATVPAAILDQLANELLLERPRNALEEIGAMDGAFTAADGTRFRFNVFRRQNQLAIALRRLEDRFRTLRELGFPDSLYSLCDLVDGLVLVCGPTGAGKSTTLATLLDRINQTRRCHIVTIEDPIEYLHRSAMSLVNQRQVGSDTASFNDALVASLRQDPDVILVGEIRDLATIRTAITAAETGHLVLTTVHAGDCVGSIERLVSVFPADEQSGIRRQLSLVLRAVIAQHLLVADGPAATRGPIRRPRVVASEVLMANPAIANLIATGKSNQIYSALETGTGQGMHTLEHDLARLWSANHITEQTAATMARNPAIMRDRAAMMKKDGPPAMSLLNVDEVRIDPAVALKLPPGLALRRKVLPFALHDGHVHVACSDPNDHSAFQSVEKFVGCPVRPEHAEHASLVRALDRVYGESPGSLDSRGRPRSVDLKNASEVQLQDVVAIGDELLHAAVLRQASDIHLDPEPSSLHVRFRVDGGLETYRRLPVNTATSLISRFKVLAGLDIAEKRSPQDGGFKHRYGRTGQGLDIRVATLPTKYGERVTLRLLALQTEGLTLERLGMVPHDLAEFERALDLPHGMILLTGPTGSGKTTTLYAAIRKILAREALNVITVEDPIEYEIPGAAQVEVDSADKVPFARALRSVLRHDPDVVMIGEVRDAETADVAIKASLTGHLVFSTLHTNSAASVITRLADMGVERYLVAATLRMAIAQRLVRRLCHRCRSPRELTTHEAAALGRPEAEGRTVYDAKGCLYCGGHGNVGRIGLFEILPVTEEWSRFVVSGAEEPEILVRMREKRIPRLIDDGAAKLFAGLISMKELMTAVAEW